MIHSNQTRRRLIACLTVVLLIAAGVLGWFRYDTINRQYPGPKQLIASQGETLTMNNEIEVSAGNLRIYSDEEFQKAYDIDEETFKYITAPYPTKNILVDITITNFSKLTSGILDEYIFRIKSDTWSNGLSVPAFQVINEGKTTPPYGETGTFTLVFSAVDSQFHTQEWESFETRPFELRVIYYPYTYTWEL